MAINEPPSFSFPLLCAALFLGLCCLFPYNSFLSSPLYLEHYYQYAAVKDTDDVSTLPQTTNTSFWDNVSNWATVMMLVPMALMQCVMMINFMLRLNLQIRICLGSALLFIAMLLMPVCASNGGVSEGGAMAVVLIACLLTGGATSLVQSSSYGLFGTFPTVYVTAFVLGGGLSGSVNSLIRIIIHYSLPETFGGVKKGAVVFYAINMALMGLVCVVVFLLRYNRVVKQCCKAFYLETGILTDPALLEAAMAADKSGDAELGSSQDPEMDKKSETAEPFESGSDEEAKKVEEQLPVDEDASSWSVAKRIWLMMFCVFMTMFTSLVYFPGFGLNAMKSDSDSEDKPVTEAPTSREESSTDGPEVVAWTPESVMPMVVILCYNAGDTVGRTVAMFPRLWMPKIGLVVLVFFRLIACMIPLVLGVVHAKIINSNANPMVVFVFLGVTNGYLVGNTFGVGCSDESLKTEREHATAGTCMAFALLIGCSVGSVVALLLVMLAL